MSVKPRQENPENIPVKEKLIDVDAALAGAVTPVVPVNVSGAPSANILEYYGEKVARSVLPELAADDKGLDIMTLMTLAISIFTTVIQNCPNPPKAKVNAMRNPSPKQMAGLFKEVYAQCSCMNQRQHVASVFRNMLAIGASTNEADALLLVNAASDDSNLLI